MRQWYTFHTKPNSEQQVMLVLEQSGIETYLPQLEIRISKTKRISKPFFPCYLFGKVNFELLPLSSVQWTPGLRRVVTIDNQPVAVREEMIKLIRHKLGEIDRKTGETAPFYKKGEPVYITGGPFQGMLAIFERWSTPRERVRVLLDILGQASRVQVEVTNLARPSEEAKGSLPKRPRRTRGRGRRIKRAAWQSAYS